MFDIVTEEQASKSSCMLPRGIDFELILELNQGYDPRGFG
jgi:hypothetical protein